MKDKIVDEELKEEICEEDAADNEEAEESADDTKYLRLLADFQNYKKRVEKEKSEIYSFANESIAKELLSILDNFERALESECQDEKYKEGMANIFKLLLDILTKNGLEEIESLGMEFDPNIHSAVATQDSDEYDSGKVSFVLQKGYKLNGKVIRVAMVKVAN
ncbi:MAG: nucleotide exchange factor GrpE [Eubacteriales bacterium]